MKKQDMRLFSVIMLISIIITLTACSHSEDEVRKKIEKHLYEEYGEEFMVDRIGTRNYPDGKTRYISRIYPKSIIGTEKQEDPYYYATAGVEKLPFGRLGKVGAGYETVQIKLEAEEYLIEKIKEMFGERVLLTTDVKYMIQKNGNDFFSWQIVSGFSELLKKTRNNPEKNRIELEIYLYIFDRIDNEQEKEERRKQIYDFVQYLKEEGLFEYLELGVIFIDERVLAPSYEEKYRIKLIISDTEREIIDGKIVYLPPMKLRKEISEVLQEELARMSEEELLKSMNRIKKSQLSYKGISKENSQYQARIYSKDMLKTKYGSSYEQNLELIKEYNNLKDIIIVNNLEYIYVN